MKYSIIKIKFFLIAFVVALSVNCQQKNLEKGELLKESTGSYVAQELNYKTVYDGKRIRVVGYFDERWSERNGKITMYFNEKPGDYNSNVLIVSNLYEGEKSNQVFLAKTGNHEIMSGGKTILKEYDAEKMRIYDNEGKPHKLNEKLSVSGTVEYQKNFGGFKNFVDGYGKTRYVWELKDIRLDTAE